MHGPRAPPDTFSNSVDSLLSFNSNKSINRFDELQWWPSTSCRGTVAYFDVLNMDSDLVVCLLVRHRAFLTEGLLLQAGVAALLLSVWKKNTSYRRGITGTVLFWWSKLSMHFRSSQLRPRHLLD
jgi:hypothetical protein